LRKKKKVKNSTVEKNVWKGFKTEECVIKKKWKVILRRRHRIDEERDKALEVCHLYSVIVTHCSVFCNRLSLLDYVEHKTSYIIVFSATGKVSYCLLGCDAVLSVRN